MTNARISEDVVALIHAIADDQRLRDWLIALKHYPSAHRVAAFGTMAAQMRDANEDARLIGAVSALAHPDIYDAACDALLEIRPR